jgi:hypothetical protein
MEFEEQTPNTLRLPSKNILIEIQSSFKNWLETFFSFFPVASQPIINLLVNPIYKFSLHFGIVKHQPIIPLSHGSSSDIRSLTMSIPSDQQDNERRRAIALKALNERWKALNAGDQTKTQQHLPKSFPQPQTGIASKQQHSHHHGHSHQHQGHGERRVIPKFDIDELIKPIPLPPPPGMMPSSPPPSSSSSLDPSTNDSHKIDFNN